MKQSTSGPLVNNLRRLQRALAESVAALAELSPVRALMALVVSIGFGTSAAVAMASVGTPSTFQDRPVAVERPTPTVSRDTDRPEVTASGSVAPAPAPARSGTPEARPSRSPKADKPERSAAPGGDESATEQAPETETTDDGSSSSTEPSDSSGPGASAESTDETPPETVLSEWFPDGDEAVFSFTAGEAATYECSLDGAPYSSCDSPASYEDLHPGWHTFVVRAIDEAGNTDPSPAVIRWHANAGSADAHEAG